MAGQDGLTVVGWLEGPQGVIWANDTDKLNFNVNLGVSYQFVSAVFGRERMLARFRNVSIDIPSEIKKAKKKFGQRIPMSSFK